MLPVPSLKWFWISSLVTVGPVVASQQSFLQVTNLVYSIVVTGPPFWIYVDQYPEDYGRHKSGSSEI